MGSARGVVKYRCPCGAEYLVAVEASDAPEWLETVRDAAKQLGLRAIDGTADSFVCADCGRTHARPPSVGAAALAHPAQPDDE